MKQHVIPTRCLDLISDRDDDKKEMRRQPESIIARLSPFLPIPGKISEI
jgi:hypothetical protein